MNHIFLPFFDEEFGVKSSFVLALVCLFTYIMFWYYSINNRLILSAVWLITLTSPAGRVNRLCSSLLDLKIITVFPYLVTNPKSGVLEFQIGRKNLTLGNSQKSPNLVIFGNWSKNCNFNGLFWEFFSIFSWRYRNFGKKNSQRQKINCSQLNTFAMPQNTQLSNKKSSGAGDFSGDFWSNFGIFVQKLLATLSLHKKTENENLELIKKRWKIPKMQKNEVFKIKVRIIDNECQHRISFSSQPEEERGKKTSKFQIFMPDSFYSSHFQGPSLSS